MKFVTELCITGYNADSNAINNTRINGFNSLLCFETFDLKPSKHDSLEIQISLAQNAPGNLRLIPVKESNVILIIDLLPSHYFCSWSISSLTHEFLKLHKTNKGYLYVLSIVNHSPNG